ncbi:MAG: hypothetical protein IPL25_03980 [Saprospiraceae bacterium]|nr:hypothetical protein [Candidatus Vicinibacter affinis]
MPNNTSQHILGSATNLIGFCLIIITSVHLNNNGRGYLFDEFTCVITLMLTFSAVFSFLSIKTQNAALENRLENIANNIFICSLIGIFLIAVIITFNFLLPTKSNHS